MLKKKIGVDEQTTFEKACRENGLKLRERKTYKKNTYFVKNDKVYKMYSKDGHVITKKAIVKTIRYKIKLLLVKK